MRPLRFTPSIATVLLLVAPNLAVPAGATGYRRHHVAHHRHDGARVAGGHVAPLFAPPSPVAAGPFALAGPQVPGLPGGGGILGTGLSDGTGLLGIGFLGL